MQRWTGEPREVRKEAAVALIRVCRRVPGHFCVRIGAFACRFDGLITRSGKDFQPWFPGLKIIHP